MSFYCAYAAADGMLGTAISIFQIRSASYIQQLQFELSIYDIKTLHLMQENESWWVAVLVCYKDEDKRQNSNKDGCQH